MTGRRLLGAALGACLAGFLAITVMVVTGTGLVHTDLAIRQQVSGGICCTPTQVFWDRLTNGFQPVVDATVLAVTGAVLAIRWRRLAPAMTSIWGLAVGGVSGLTVKYAVGRVPPDGPYHAQGAYPSGHTLSAVMFLGLAVLIASRGRWRGVLLTLVAGVTALVASGLVYDHYHWLTDVLGSLFLGPLLLYWVTLTPPYRSCQRILAARGRRAAAGTSDAERPADDLLHDLGGAAVDRLNP